MIIIDFILGMLLFVLILTSIIGLVIFVIYTVRWEWLHRNKHGFLPTIYAIIFLLVIIGGIFRAVQGAYNCYKSTGELTCGGNAPEDDNDFLFPVPK